MKTVRRPPYPKWNPGYSPCSSLTLLPLSSRRPSVSFGGFGLTRLVGVMLRDVVLTRDEVDGLMAGLLTSRAAPAGTTRLAGWLDGNADILGRKYVSELWRNYRR